MALTHTPYSVHLLTSHCISLTSSYSGATVGAVDVTGIIAGVVVVLVLLTLLGLTAGDCLCIVEQSDNPSWKTLTFKLHNLYIMQIPNCVENAKGYFLCRF